MKRYLLFGMVLLLLLSSVALAEDFKVRHLPHKAVLAGEVEYVPGEVLVKFKEGVSKGEVTDLNRALGLAVLSVHRA